MSVPGRPVFLIAKNPDPFSKLPFLIRLPLGNHAVDLKAADRWPRTAKVYCHGDATWPDDPEIVEAVPVRSCVRRSQAIDLVLDRSRENRSQVIFTTIRGREGIFWQSPKTTRAARPTVRVPQRVGDRRGDNRRRHPRALSLSVHPTTLRPYRQTLPAGDYGVEHDGTIVAAVERKSIADLSKSLVDGSLTYALAELASLERAAVVVEDRYSAVFKLEHVAPGFIADLLGAMQVRYPQVPIVFCDTRPLAEEWTFRFLGAALAHARTPGTEP